jgi:hypothetical protein
MDTLLTGPLLYLTAAWGIVTSALILLSFYRGSLSSKEEGREQVYLDEAESRQAAEEQALSVRLLRLSGPLLALRLLSLVLLLVIVGMWISARWDVLGTDEVVRRLRGAWAALPTDSLAAVRADSPQLHVRAIDREAAQLGPSPVDPDIQAGEVHVPDVPAPAADEVVVIVGVHVELDRGAGHLERPDQALPHEFLEVPVHRRMRHRRQHPSHALHHVVGCGMAHCLAQRAQQHVPLRREPQPAIGAGRAEVHVAVSGWVAGHVTTASLGRRAAGKVVLRKYTS